MSTSQKPSKNLVWQLFISVKFTVIVLILLAITSAAGTIIPQNGDPQQYIEMYGTFGSSLIQVFDLFDMYHSWWFRSLMGLLTINIIICTIDRWPATWRIITSKKFNPEQLLTKKPYKDFKDERTPVDLKPLYTSFMKKQYTVKGVHTLQNGFRVYGEKGRWSKLGVPVVHMSIVLILIGALVGSFWGFDGYVNVPEGGSADRIRLRNSNKIMELGFKVACKDFNIEYYESGAVKEYRSALQILKNDKVLLEKDIIVNDPLKFNGIRFFQSSYGALPPENIEIKIVSKDSQEPSIYKTKIGETIQLPGNSGELTITRFNKDYHFKKVELGQAIEGELRLNDKDPVKIVLPYKYPTFDKMRKGQWIISLEEYDNKFYTGLQVRRDPGIFLVYLGFILILGGCWVIFFSSHQKILLEVTTVAEISQTKIFGSTTRNKMDFKQRIEKMANELKLL
ncbi:MAG: cytochrome c biogenesis protein ResB [Desulfobacula sp.]|nr:cytochrome c biogenesis protein ResB [Desulfobacula sp.]